MALPPTESFVDPYLFAYVPFNGKPAGAAQNYGARVNWLGANRQLLEQIVNVRQNENNLFAAWRRTYRPLTGTAVGAKGWPANHLLQSHGTPYVPLKDPSTNVTTLSDRLQTNAGEQITGVGLSPPDDGNMYRKLTRDALPFPYNWQIWKNGVWLPVNEPKEPFSGLGSFYFPKNIQISGSEGQRPFFTNGLMAAATERARVPRSGGLGPTQFCLDFPPLPYAYPFSGGDMRSFPAYFSPLYDPTNPARPFQGY